MSKKILAVSIALIFILTGLATISSGDINNIESVNQKVTSMTDANEELDQYQNDTQGSPMLVGRIGSESEYLYIQTAQSFKPNKDIITKVELKVQRNATTIHPLVVALRNNLNGVNLVEKSVQSLLVNAENPLWIEVNINDTFVDIGETYYIVCYTDNITENWYTWSGNNDSTSYPYGDAWYSNDSGNTWSNKSRIRNSRPRNIGIHDEPDMRMDMCFRTYGRDSTELDINFKMFGKGLSTSFENIGSVNATGLTFEVNVEGGIFDGIDNTTGGILLPPLNPDGEFQINTTFFGFGMVDITAEAYASNALKVTKTARGFVFFSYIFVIPDISV
jgi:hypothetical protein